MHCRTFLCGLTLGTLSAPLVVEAQYFELYDKWFGERSVVPYPMSDQVRNYMNMQSIPE